MQTSETLGKFADALAKVQGTMKAATKDATNPHFGNKYADLTAIMAACRAGLSAHGIAINQFVGAVDAVVTVTTRLTHTSGEWVSSSLTVRARDVSPQSIGSACSYARRYSLAAAGSQRTCRFATSMPLRPWSLNGRFGKGFLPASSPLAPQLFGAAS